MDPGPSASPCFLLLFRHHCARCVSTSSISLLPSPAVALSGFFVSLFLFLRRSASALALATASLFLFSVAGTSNSARLSHTLLCSPVGRTCCLDHIRPGYTCKHSTWTSDQQQQAVLAAGRARLFDSSPTLLKAAIDPREVDCFAFSAQHRKRLAGQWEK